MNANAAVSSNHPHNDWIYIASSFGGLGLFAWLLLVLHPLWNFISDYKAKPLASKIVFLAFSSCLCHSMFDLVFFAWPTAVIAFLLLGLLWTEAWPVGEANEMKRSLLAKTLLPLKWLLAATCVIGAFYYASSYAQGVAWSLKAIKAQQAGDQALAMAHNRRAIEAYPYDPILLYRAATQAHVYAMDYRLAILYLDKLAQSPWPDFAHSHGFRGFSLLRLGSLREAIPEFERESKNIPPQ